VKRKKPENAIMTKRWTRREVLRSTALAGLSGWLVSRSTGADPKSAHDKLNIAIIGCTGRGAANLDGVKSENIVALCDVDEARSAKTFDAYPRAKKFNDFRHMLDKMDRQIDAVVVSTTDHTHAPASVAAMKMGKHCYCEKPLTHTVSEARLMAEVAARNKLATQIGTQIHAGANYRRVVELVQSGAVGTVQEVHVWIGYGGGHAVVPKETPPVPPTLKWDLWIGPAPMRPYHPCYLAGGWRGWSDFASGTIGDLGPHYLDLPYWALQLQHPLTIEAEGPKAFPGCPPWILTVRYEFLARGDLPPVKLHYYQGHGNTKIIAEKNLPNWSTGVLFVGSKGMVLSDYNRHLLLPETQFAGFKPPVPTIPRSIGHHQEWILACKTGRPTTCNFQYAGPMNEALLLGNVAHRVGQKLQWDPVNLKARNCPEAEQYIHHHYRQGWIL
jgi:predicted dehydrogenase